MLIMWVIRIMKCSVILVGVIVVLFEHCENFRLMMLLKVAIDMV